MTPPARSVVQILYSVVPESYEIGFSVFAAVKHDVITTYPAEIAFESIRERGKDKIREKEQKKIRKEIENGKRTGKRIRQVRKESEKGRTFPLWERLLRD